MQYMNNRLFNNFIALKLFPVKKSSGGFFDKL